VKHYTASKSQSQGREGWSVIFRHPTRIDPNTQKPGRRVRRGLGTSIEAEADRLVDQLNVLLSSPELWEPSARATAEIRFDSRVVEIFFDGAEASSIDFRQVRDDSLPLPAAEDGYRRVLLLGTTGAGKTTVVRQILGTDPETERFPSTSTAKTTVADTEVIVTDEPAYRAVVTFVPRDQIVDYLTENVAEAARTIFNGGSEARVINHLLNHVNQRFRFSYVLGHPAPAGADSDDEDDDDDNDDSQADILDISDGPIDLDATRTLILESVDRLRTLVRTFDSDSRSALDAGDEDPRLIEEILEEELDNTLRQSDEFHQIIDALSDEIEKRFATLTRGETRRTRQGWPISWTWSSEDRTEFLNAVARFSSNYAPLFGRLLTPLVNGIRVSGPFTPTWSDVPRKLVLVDGEGLGHTPTSAAALSTPVVRQINEVDSILLVDNAAQPMQAAPTAALKSIASSGSASKLCFLFTHFDQVTGDNLNSLEARKDHVLASVENVMKAIGEELGPPAERGLRHRLDAAQYFVGGIQKRLVPDKKAARQAVEQLSALLDVLAEPHEPSEPGPSRPVFSRGELTLAVTDAAFGFHQKWQGLLGLKHNSGAPKEHWTRIKALSRRLAEGWFDEYDTLKPVADLRDQLQKQLYLMLQRPARWDGGEPGDDEKQLILDQVSNAISRKLLDLTHRRVAEDQRLLWRGAFALKGSGSTFERAQLIAVDLYGRAAPVPSATRSPVQNQLLKDVTELINQVAEELDLVLE
jgi:hypothetical protein